jgi:hypothetical protein
MPAHHSQDFSKVRVNCGWHSAQGVRQLSRRETTVGTELSGNNVGKTFIGLSSGVCTRAEVCSLQPDFVNPKTYLRSREYILPRMISSTEYNFDPWDAFVSEEFDEIALFNFDFSALFTEWGTFAR